MNDDLLSIQNLLTHTERQRDEAFAEQHRLDAAKRAADAQAAQLLAYRSDYEARWSAQFSREGKIELVRCYQDFVQRLTFAVEQQQRVARHAATQLERATAIVRGHDIRAAALAKLIERRLQDGRRAGAMLEQKQSDEHAARAAWLRLAAANAQGAA